MSWKREPLTEDELGELLDAADEHDVEHQGYSWPQTSISYIL